VEETGGSANFADLPQPESAPVKTANFADSHTGVAPAERGGRGRFVLPARAEPEAGYQLTPEIMGTVVPTGSVDRAAQFQALAMRERFETLARRYWVTRGMHGR
jgi:hypothetical protein